MVVVRRAAAGVQPGVAMNFVVIEMRRAGGTAHDYAGPRVKTAAGGKTLCGLRFVPRVGFWTRDTVKHRARTTCSACLAKAVSQ